MRRIRLKDAASSLSTAVDEAVRGNPSVITRPGKPHAVVLGFEDWQRLNSVPSFGRLLMAAPLDGADVERDAAPGRDTGL